jgi:hypothetical protein
VRPGVAHLDRSGTRQQRVRRGRERQKVGGSAWSAPGVVVWDGGQWL